jgi:hypothetical protein
MEGAPAAILRCSFVSLKHSIDRPRPHEKSPPAISGPLVARARETELRLVSSHKAHFSPLPRLAVWP